uniref:Uncharacterized protein n=1 Tax=Panagrolaimus sp. PS1159 TaxID=55785 RepID=A0AC35G529_9BILA
MVHECISAGNELKAWKSRKNGIGFAKDSENLELYSFVDCFEIILCKFGYLLFVGSRDKSIQAWNLKDLKTHFLQKSDVHISWITNLVGLSKNQLLSFGYDGSIKLWDIEFKNLQCISTICLKSIVLDFALNSFHLFTLSGDNIIRMISHSTNKLILKWTVTYFKSQTTAITCNKMNDTVFYCSNKNGWIASLNTKNWKKLNSIKLENFTVLTMKFINNEIYCGLDNGDLIILSSTLKILKVQ